MKMSVAELQSRIDSRELSEWMAYDRIEPPDFWPSTFARLLYWIGCLWAKKPPRFQAFFPLDRSTSMSSAEKRVRFHSSVR